MTTSKKTRSLAPVARATAMAFEAELMHLRRVAARERQLRLSLEALDKRAAERFLESVDRSVTGEVQLAESQDRAWRDWISVRRGRLQAELALVLAEKTERMERLSRSLGRKDIAARMHGASQSEDRRAQLARDLANLQDLAVLLKANRDRPVLH